MKILKKLAIFFLALVVIILIAARIYTRNIISKPMPDYTSTLAIKGLIDEVQIFRTAQGVPHIYAKNEHDVYLATGYIMAQERMWQMDLLRRVTQGRLSEIFGKDMVDTDWLLRSLRFSEKSERIIGKSDSLRLLVLEAFSEGVNYYIEDYADKLPIEFFLLGYSPEKWKPEHTLNLIGYMAWDLKAGWDPFIAEQIRSKVDSAKAAEILPQLANYTTSVFEDADAQLLSDNRLQQLTKLEQMGLDVFCGSNNWAVSGAKSYSGQPLLANDMHLNYGLPGIWFPMHQVVEGKLNVTGLAVAGAPLCIVGHNNDIAWGMTNTYVDNLDMYLEKVNPADTNQYLLNGEWRKFIIKKEEIRSKDGTVYTRINRFTHRGPIVTPFKKTNGKIISIHWVGDDESDEFSSIYEINRATNWEEFNSAFKGFQSISQNIVYADRHGNIGLHACAGVPVRKRDIKIGLLPGDTTEYDWQSKIPYDELPYEYNPERKYVSSANNRTANEAYPYHIGSWYSMPYRIERIREMLEAKEILSVADFKAMQTDNYSKLAERIVNSILALVDTTQIEEIHKKVYSDVLSWDRCMDADQYPPYFIELFGLRLVEACVTDELGNDLFNDMARISKYYRIALFNLLSDYSSKWYNDIQTARLETSKMVFTDVFQKVVDEIVEKHGKNEKDWLWGKMHFIELKHPLSKVDLLEKIFHLNSDKYSVGGSYHTVAPYTYPVFEPGNVIHGASHRSIYDVSNWDSSWVIIPAGVSGLPGSEFYTNQSNSFMQGEYFRDWFTFDAIKQHAMYRQLLQPK